MGESITVMLIMSCAARTIIVVSVVGHLQGNSKALGCRASEMSDLGEAQTSFRSNELYRSVPEPHCRYKSLSSTTRQRVSEAELVRNCYSKIVLGHRRSPLGASTDGILASLQRPVRGFR